jgi:DNA mismatch repair ATPase MutS
MLVINLPMRYVTDRRIGAIASSIRQCAPVIGAAGSLRFMAGDGVEPLASVLREDVPRLTRLKWISSWANGNPFMVSFDSSQLSIMFSDLASVLYEYFNLFLLLDATGVYFGVRDLRAHRVSLLRVIAVIGDIDAAISVASYREGRDDWTRPQFRSEGTVTLTDLRHPLIDDAVPNSIVLRAGGGALVTGSNMSGKSTFLRTVGVNAILAQALNTCLAREYTGPRFVVRSCIGRSDDLLAGKSYYIVEVEALLGLVRLSESDRPHLFLLDELFRGTNAIERIAAGQGVLQELVEGEHSATPHVVVAATHDGELVGLLGSAYDAYHFGDSLSPGGLVFDHRLNPGPGTTRTAIALLAQHGAPQRLLSRAKATAAMLDRQRNL